MSINAAARQLGASAGSVWVWKRAYERRGDVGLEPKPRSGQGSRLTPRQKRSLIRTLDRGGLWTGPQVRRLIWQRFGVHYHVDHVGRLLHQLGYSPQWPRKQAREQDGAAVARWRKRTWPRIVKKGD
jgi:transposase